MITADILKAIMGTDELDSGRDWERVPCPYCNGEHHLMVDPLWLAYNEIPRDITITDWYLAPINRAAVYIPCDCMADMKNNPDQRQPRTFREYFFEPLKQHWYGRAILARREQLRALLEEGVAKAKADRAGLKPPVHDPADEIEDPPEAVMDWANYELMEVEG